MHPYRTHQSCLFSNLCFQQPFWKEGCNQWQQSRLSRKTRTDVCSKLFCVFTLKVAAISASHKLVCNRCTKDGRRPSLFCLAVASVCTRTSPDPPSSVSLPAQLPKSVHLTTVFASSVQHMAATAPPVLCPCRHLQGWRPHHPSSMSLPARLPQSVHPPQPCLQAGCNRWQQPLLLCLALADLCQDQAFINRFSTSSPARLPQSVHPQQPYLMQQMAATAPPSLGPCRPVQGSSLHQSLFCVFTCTVAAICPSRTTLFASRVQQMAATAPPVLWPLQTCARIKPSSIAFLRLHLHGCRNLCIPHNLVCKQGATDDSNRASCSLPLADLCQDQAFINRFSASSPARLPQSVHPPQPCLKAGCNKWQQPRLLYLPLADLCKDKAFINRFSASSPARLPQSVHPQQPCLQAGCNRWQQPRLLRLALADLCKDKAFINLFSASSPARLPQSVHPPQPCLKAGCNRWQQPRLLFFAPCRPVPGSSLHQSLFCVFTCTVAAICASPTTLFESRVQQMAATAPPVLCPLQTCARIKPSSIAFLRLHLHGCRNLCIPHNLI